MLRQTPSPPRLRAAALGMAGALLLASLAASGHGPSQQDLLAGVVADHAIVVDTLRGFDPGDPGELVSVLPDTLTGVASSGKSWSLHMAFHALDEGLVTQNEVVTVGASAMSRPCNCQPDTLGNRMYQGEQFRFWDAVMGSYVRSSNDLTTVFTEHIGLKLAQSEGGTCSTDFPSPNVPYPSTCMQRFLDWANEHLHEPEVGASATTNIVWPYIADTVTVRDVAKWFNHAIPDPRFQDAASTTAWSFTNLQGNKSYAPTRALPAIPGIEGWKHGSTAVCNGDAQGCLVVSANRIGRRLITAIAESARDPDAIALLDWSYDTLFHPTSRGASPPWLSVKDHALACVGPIHAVSAALRPSGVPYLLLWGQGRSGGLTMLDEVGGPQFPNGFGLGMLPPLPLPEPGPAIVELVESRTAPTLRGASDLWRPAGAALGAALAEAREQAHGAGLVPPVELGEEAGPVELEQVEVTHVGPDRVVVAHREGATVLLSSWAIEGGKLQLLQSDYYIGKAADVSLAPWGATGFVVVAQDLGANTRVGAFRLSASGAIQHVGSSTEPVPGTGTAVAVLDGNAELGIPSFVVTATHSPLVGLSQMQVNAWRLTDAGTLTHEDDFLYPFEGSRVAITALNLLPKPGEAFAPAAVMVAFGIADQLGFSFLTVEKDEGLTFEGTTFNQADIGDDEPFLVASLGAHSGVLTASRTGPGADTELRVWEMRNDVPGFVNVLPVSEHPFAGPESLQGLCRQRTGQPPTAEGDYLLAAVEEGKLGLEAWRSGPRA